MTEWPTWFVYVTAKHWRADADAVLIPPMVYIFLCASWVYARQIYPHVHRRSVLQEAHVRPVCSVCSV